jgi:hypothetical protein
MIQRTGDVREVVVALEDDHVLETQRVKELVDARAVGRAMAAELARDQHRRHS